MEKVSKKKDTALVRLDANLRDAISTLAEIESRSIGQQIKVMYESYVKDKK